MGLRIINAGKSKYYGAAISNFDQARGGAHGISLFLIIIKCI
jgi:hypothetical protein